MINDNPYIINYNYSINYIKNMFNSLNEQEYFIKQLILSKIIIELINNYEIYDEFEEIEKIEEYNKELNKIKDNCKIKIKDSLNDLKKNIDLSLELDDILSKELDAILIKIIISLIKNNKYKMLNILINQLNIKSINITNDMLYEILEFFKGDKKDINIYEILTTEDFSNNSKINFYFILFKYILKNSIYIYKIPFLLETKRRILSIIKSKLFLENNDIKEKIEFVLNIFLDSKYYLKYIIYKKKRALSLPTNCIISPKNNDGKIDLNTTASSFSKKQLSFNSSSTRGRQSGRNYEEK